MEHDNLSMLLTELYAGIVDPTRIARFIHVAAPLLGSHSGAFSIRQPTLRRGATLAMGGAEANEEVRRRYDSTYITADDNLWFQRSHARLRGGTVVLGDDVATAAEMKRTRYHADFLRGIDTLHSLAICVDAVPQRVVMLSFCRSERMGAYDASHVDAARRLAPHVTHAFALMELHRRAARVADLRVGRFELDGDLRVIAGDEQAERMISTGCLRLTPARALEARSAQSQSQWLVHCRARRADPCGRLPPVPLYAADASLVALMSLEQTGLFNPEAPVKYVCRVRILRSPEAIDLQPSLSAMFGLSAAEARLACALHATRDLAEAATRSGVTLATARTRLATVFAKTHTHKQSTFLALLDALVECALPVGTGAA